ncbi:hypothetical protein ACH5RR_030312 [Cinchona calisaya]|uniref:Uncharacterized protein n=1 Tax=Cinchona calisaya TaxID=153742 RepID=A0ABD2YWF6_9GENT
MHLKEKLSVNLGSKPFAEYLQSIKTIADELALIDSPLSDDDITIHVLNGVGLEFQKITATIREHESPISFEALHDKLTDYATFLQRENIADIPIQANFFKTKCA